MHGFEELSKRLGRLRSASGYVPSVVKTLPSGEGLWRKLDALSYWMGLVPQKGLGNFEGEAKKWVSKIEKQRGLIAKRAEDMIEAQQKMVQDFYNEMDKFCDGLAQMILHAEEAGANSLDLEHLQVLLAGMRDNIYPLR